MRIPVLTTALIALLAAAAHAESPPVFLMQWALPGGTNGQFPPSYSGLGLDAAGHVNVVDMQLSRVSRYSPAGMLECTSSGGLQNPRDIAFASLGYASNGTPQVVEVDGSCSIVGSWPFGNIPNYVAVDATRNTLYSTVINYAVAYDLNGTFERSWPFAPDDPGPRPFGLGPSGTLYFVDPNRHVVRKYGPTGAFLGSWSGHGHGDSTLVAPSLVTVGPDECVYVVDDVRIKKFTAGGEFLTSWGQQGHAVGQYAGIADLCVDGDGNVYVLDDLDHRVVKYGLGTVPTRRSSWGALKLLYR